MRTNRIKVTQKFGEIIIPAKHFKKGWCTPYFTGKESRFAKAGLHILHTRQKKELLYWQYDGTYMVRHSDLNYYSEDRDR